MRESKLSYQERKLLVFTVVVQLFSLNTCSLKTSSLITPKRMVLCLNFQRNALNTCNLVKVWIKFVLISVVWEYAWEEIGKTLSETCSGSMCCRLNNNNTYPLRCLCELLLLSWILWSGSLWDEWPKWIILYVYLYIYIYIYI